MASRIKKMTELITGSGNGATGATDMLREDHQKVKRIFDEFEGTEESAAKRRLVEKALIELTVHSKLEEEMFYPAARRKIDDSELMDEAEEEHHVVELIIGELASMKPSDERYDAKFTVLAESVRHHIKEEEQEMLPKIEKAGLDLETLGQEMRERKMTLMEEVSLDSIRGEAWPAPGQTPRRARTVRRASSSRRSRRAIRGSKSRRASRRSAARSGTRA